MTGQKPATLVVRSGIASCLHHHAAVPPLYLSTNYESKHFGQVPTYDYARGVNSTRTLLEKALASLENGAVALVTNCGISAINLLLCLLRQEDSVIVPHDCYGGHLSFV